MRTKYMKTLLIIDYQNDYCEGGPQAFGDTLEKIPKINRIRYLFDNVIFTKNEYLPNHPIFTKCKPHCIKGTKGCDINDNLLMSKKDVVIVKNTTLGESKSAFYETSETKTKLYYLLSNSDVYVCGINLEKTIFSTVLDCYKHSIKCVIIEDCVCHNMGDKVYEEMMEFVRGLGVDVVRSCDL